MGGKQHLQYIYSFIIIFLKSFFGAVVRGAFLPQLRLLFKDGHLKKVCFRGVRRCVFGWVGGGCKAYSVRKKVLANWKLMLYCLLLGLQDFVRK